MKKRDKDTKDNSEHIPALQQFRISKRMLQVIWQLRPRAVVAYFAGAALETVAFIVAIYATAKLGGLLASFRPGAPTDEIWLWLWVDVLAGLCIGLGFWLMQAMRRLLYYRCVQWSTDQFHAALCRLDIEDYYDDEMRNKINKVQGGYTWQLANFQGSLLDLLYGIIRFIATAVVVAQIAWWLIAIIAVSLIPSLLIQSRIASMQWFVWDAKGDQRQVFWGLDWIIRNVKGQMELRSAQARHYVQNRIKALNVDFYDEQEAKFTSANRLSIPAQVIETAGTAIGSVILLRQFLGGLISLERYFFLAGALLRIGSALNNVFGTLSRMQESFLFVQSYFELIDRQPVIVDKTDAYQLQSSHVPVIKFEHVSFTYPGSSTPVFEDLNLVIKPGEHVALVGENGAGKSTLIKLLLRFYLPTSGRITIDDVDLQDIAIESWYSHLATLFQDFNHYPFSVSENITLSGNGKKIAKASTRLREAASASDVDNFVKNYDYGWNTMLDQSFNNGIEPSGGQWQRVALARAFYRRASILILDEPTSAIDAKAEYDIFNSIFEHYQHKSVVIVSHRFSTVRRAHTILVVERGKIIEQGSHSELMKHRGLYYDLFSKQAEGYLD